jgi:hypothetical protein
MVLLLTAIAVVFGAIALGGEGETSNVVWILFLGSAAGAFYFYWQNRGEGQGSSRGYGPTSSSSERSGSDRPGS